MEIDLGQTVPLPEEAWRAPLHRRADTPCPSWQSLACGVSCVRQRRPLFGPGSSSALKRTIGQEHCALLVRRALYNSRVGHDRYALSGRLGCVVGKVGDEGHDASGILIFSQNFGHVLTPSSVSREGTMVLLPNTMPSSPQRIGKADGRHVAQR